MRLSLESGWTSKPSNLNVSMKVLHVSFQTLCQFSGTLILGASPLTLITSIPGKLLCSHDERESIGTLTLIRLLCASTKMSPVIRSTLSRENAANTTMVIDIVCLSFPWSAALEEWDDFGPGSQREYESICGAREKQK